MSGSADSGSGPCHTVTAEETVLWLTGPALLWLTLSLPLFFFFFPETAVSASLAF